MNTGFFYLLVVSTLLFACSPEVQEDKVEESSPKVAVPVLPDTFLIRTMIVEEAGTVQLMRVILPDSKQDPHVKQGKDSSFSTLQSLGCHISGGVGNADPIDKSYADEMTVVYQVTKLERKESELPFRMTIKIQVKDYPTWRWLFDSEEKSRSTAGLQLQQLGTEVGAPGNVFMIYALSDIKKAREMMDEPGIEEKMDQAGVIGEAEICFWKPVSSEVN